MMKRLYASCLVLFCAAPAHAELIDLKILQREPYADGKSFGDVGPYEKIVGVARFAVDPNHPKNRVIVDLDLAPRNAQGKVEFESDVYILAPKDLARGNGAIFYDGVTAATSSPWGCSTPPPKTRSSCAAVTPSSGAAGSANCSPAASGCS